MVDQVGGSHYSAKYQHWDLVADTAVGYLEGCSTKYISRWRHKNGLLDLEKGSSFVDKLVEKYDAGYRNVSMFKGTNSQCFVAHEFFDQWLANMDLLYLESAFCRRLFTWDTRKDLLECRDIIKDIEETYNAR